MSKKEKITLGVLGGLLIALILIYVLAVAPLLEEKSDFVPPELREGEGLYLGQYVTLFPEVAQDKVLSIDVTNKEGSYGFFVKETDKGNKTFIRDHESLGYDMSVYAYLLAYSRLPVVPVDTNIYRDVSDEDMAKYGLTDKTCLAKVKVKYLNAKNQEETQTIVIGNKIISSATFYYATIEGRNHVYTMNGAGVEGAILKPLESYISPVVYNNFQNSSTAALFIKDFALFTTNKVEGNDATTVFMLSHDPKYTSGTSVQYLLTCPKIYPQGVVASTSYITDAYNVLFTTFQGEKVVKILPKDASKDEINKLLEEYGLAEGQDQFMIYAKGKNQDDESLVMYISKEIEGYHYVISAYHSEDVVIAVPSSTLYFLGEGEETAIKWTATNSVLAGFNSYLVQDPNINEPGVDTIKIFTVGNFANIKGYDKTFKVSYSTGKLVITSTDGEYSFDVSKGETLFSKLYSVIVAMPKPTRFTDKTEQEKAELQAEDNLIYQIEVKLNDGKRNENGIICGNTVMKYSYYLIDAGYSLCTVEFGTVNEDQSYTYDDAKKEVIFEVMTRHIFLVAEAYEKMLKGEDFIQNDYIS